MNILVACECSGIVRQAFTETGHNAWSCDLKPSEIRGQHIQGDVREILYWDYWDLVIAHPPCTDLSSSGARWFEAKRKDGRQQASVDFFMLFTRLECPYAIENPIGVMSNAWRRPDQIIQPWQFGHGETKATCLWLNKLPLLKPTNIVEGREQRIWRMSPGANRATERSKTFEGVARAMSSQWGAI